MPNYKRVFELNRNIFITVVTDARKPLLIDNINLLRKSFANSKRFYNYEITAIVVLPDHFHILMKPNKIEEYPKIISRIKHHFSRNLEYTEKNLSKSKLLKREKGIWQRRYWEHTIRSEKDLYKHIDYIHYNPVKHNLVNSAKDWEYSTFKKFVDEGLYELNWCNFEDTNQIVDLNLE